MRRKKIKFLHTTETAAIGKSFMQNLIKNNIFSAHQYQNFRNFNIKYLQWSKRDLSKETKKDSQKRYRTNF